MNATMETLERTRPGAVIQVAGQPWERTAEGLKRNNVVLGLEHFTAFVNGGQVIVPPSARWETNQWYNRSGGYRLVTGEVDGEVHALDFTINRGDVTAVTFAADTPITPWSPVPARNIRAWQNRVRHLYELLTEAPDGAIPEPFVRVLHAYAERAGDAEFDGILDEHGISRAREHVSTVTIDGRNRWVPDTATASHVLGDEVTVREVGGSVNIYWQRVVPVTLSGSGCTCSQVTRDVLSQYVPEGVREWHFSTACAEAQADPF